MEVLVSEISVGKRHRKEMGDIDALAESIERLGLLHPVVLTPEKRLVVGERRLRAFKRLKRDKIPANIARSLTELSQFLEAERDENTCRLDFDPLEKAAIIKDTLPIAKELAAKAQEQGHKAGGGDRRSDKTKRSGPSCTKAKARDNSKRALAIAAKAAGVNSPTTAIRLLAVVESGREDLKEEMKRTGKVNGAYKKLKRDEAADAIRAEPPPLPKGPFRVLVVDPPWKYDARPDDPSHRAANPYPSMSIEEIAAMPVGQLAAKDSVIWLWVTNSHLPEIWPIVKAWGFTYKTMLTWVKNNMGTGDWLRGKTEHCLMCVRGNPTITLTNQTTVIHGPLREHSRKPNEFYELVDGLCPGSKCELFQREPRKGYVGHGNEV